jgi:hypothetical protein
LLDDLSPTRSERVRLQHDSHFFEVVLETYDTLLARIFASLVLRGILIVVVDELEVLI